MIRERPLTVERTVNGTVKAALIHFQVKQPITPIKTEIAPSEITPAPTFSVPK